MEYGIIIACVSLMGTFALVLADLTEEVGPSDSVGEATEREWRQAA